MLVSTLKHIETKQGDSHFSKFINFVGNSHLVDLSERIKNQHFHSCHLLMRNNEAVGRYALYTNEQLQYQDHKVICIAAYACIEDDTIAEILLNQATNLCRDLGYTFIIGPMKGSTWNAHRFSTDSDRPYFFSDLHNPLYYNEQFLNNNFYPIAHYSSGIGELQKPSADTMGNLEKYYEGKGAVIRNIDLENLKKELYKIAEFSNQAFANNFLFTPLNPDSFVQKYMQLRSLMNRDLIWLVENDKQELQSFIFAYPDFYSTKEKGLIIKSVAGKGDSPFRGITTFIFKKLLNQAYYSGYRKVIHAFIHNSNLSLTTSKKYPLKYKQYALYGKSLL